MKKRGYQTDGEQSQDKKHITDPYHDGLFVFSLPPQGLFSARYCQALSGTVSAQFKRTCSQLTLNFAIYF